MLEVKIRVTPFFKVQSSKITVCSDKDSKLNLFKDYPQDYCAEMKDVPASPIGSTSGANIVNIGMWIKVSSKFEIEVLQPN